MKHPKGKRQLRDEQPFLLPPDEADLEPETEPEPEPAEPTEPAGVDEAEVPVEADGPAEPQTPAPSERRKLEMHRNLRRAVLRWLERQDAPTAAATTVATRIARFHADVAAFWSKPVRNPHHEGPSQVLSPVRTCIVQCHLERQECWPDCSRSAELVPKLRGLKTRRGEVQVQIRQDEPDLREGDSLFEEYAEWRYEESRNTEYHRLRREIEKTEQALYHGTRFERIRRAALADVLYLAVPENLVLPEELADGWGLLWIGEDLQVRVAVEATPRECLAGNRLHLVQNIAAAAARSVLFAHGIEFTGAGVPLFVKPPRAHRKPEPGTVRD